MTVLHASSQIAKEILDALCLPKNTMGFTLSMKAGQPAVLHASMLVEESAGKGLVEVSKRYELNATEYIEPTVAEPEVPDPEDVVKPK